MKKIAILTLGCKINQYESNCIISDFIKQGYTPVLFSQEADVYIVNTCTVTSKADAKSRKAIRKALQKKVQNKNVKVIVTGCYSQVEKNEAKKLGNIDLIVKNKEKNKIFSLLNKEDKPFFPEKYLEHSTDIFFNRQRAFIKIQDGCNFFCSYCKIPFARGNPYSRNPQKIISQINLLIKNSYLDFIIGGINLGLYSYTLNDKNYNLLDILNEIENKTALESFKISSIEPQHLPPLFDFIKKSKKILPHFHLPLQSGNDEILKLMNRKYNTSFFEDLINSLLKIDPYIAIGIDLIVGFPHENEKHFRQTYEFLEKLNFTYLHVFPFSKRKDTKAAEYKEQVANKEKIERRNILLKLSQTKTKAYIQKLIENKIVMQGVVETKKGKYFTGTSSHYLKFYFENTNFPKNKKIYFLPIEEFEKGVLVKILC